MDVTQVIKNLSSAVTDAKAKSDTLTSVSAAAEAAMTNARSAYDGVVSAEKAKVEAAATAYRDAKVAVERLQAELRDALGDVFAADPRVRMG